MTRLSNLRLLFAMAVVGAAAAGCGGSDSSPAPAPAPAPTPAPPPPPPPTALLNNPDPASGCAALAPLATALSATGMQVAITSATLKATTTPDANGDYQPYCAVVGTINAGRVGTMVAGQTAAQTTYAIGFQVNLPSAWNGKLFFSGGGGTDGSIPNTTGTITDGEAVNPLLLGYATASDDSGHNGSNSDSNNAGGAAFGLDEQARVDFGYNAIGVTKKLANGLISSYYAQAQKHSYFVGCSEGGREAMMVAQRYGDQFDGVVAGDPGSDLPKGWMAEAWNTQQFSAAAASQGFFETTGPGAGTTPLMNAAVQPAQWTALQQAVLDQCDATDGLVDGMVNKTCNFDPSVLACGAAGAPAACWQPAQLTAIQNVDLRREEFGGHVALFRLAVGPGHRPGRLAGLEHGLLQHDRHQQRHQRHARRRRRPAHLHDAANHRSGHGEFPRAVPARLQLGHRPGQAHGDDSSLQ